MSDKGVKETEEALSALETRIERVYKEQKREAGRKLKSFMQDFEEKNGKKKKSLEAGKITQDQYDAWLKGQMFQQKWFKEMVNQFSEDMTLADVKAISMVKGFMPEAYAINRNFGAFEAEKGALVDTSFTLYDAHTVENLVKNRPRLLPDPSPDIPKELRWHQIKITNAIRDGILQGESIPNIAKRLEAVTDMDHNAAIRNARTATTGAQNAGRVDSYKDAEKLGIQMEQQWVATLDSRTRDRHRIMDGEKVKPGEKFSNNCRYPGDPAGEAGEIYNCRCTLIGVVAGVDFSKAHRASKLGDMSYEDWKYNKNDTKKYEHYADLTKKKMAELGNPTYSGIWKDDVKLSDYASKKDAIQGKKDWYEQEIDKLENDPDYKKWLTDEQKKEKIDAYTWYLEDLEDFEKKGALYEKYQNELADYNKKLKDLKGDTTPFTADAYSEERKRAAKKFSDKYEADRYLRPELDRQWDNLSDAEKYGTWKYTENSNPMNKPLSGYEESWYRKDFKGVGNARWDYEDSWRWNPDGFEKYGHENGTVDHAKAISGLTTGIDKCELADDMWFVRGTDINGLAGLFEGEIISFDQAKRLLENGDIDTLKSMLEGQVFQNHAFTSTGIAKGTGFSDDVMYDIFAPKGTKAIYAEPQSHYGDTVGRRDVLYRPGQSYKDVSREAETIFQRGTYYRLNSIDMKGYRDYKVNMEIVGQPDYFKTGYEQTIDGGKTSWKH